MAFPVRLALPARLSCPARLYKRLCDVALAALVVIVVTGGGVRLTRSGLGCTDWPTCTNDRLVPQWEFHGMVEFVNRVFTGVVSFAVIAAVAGALVRQPRRRGLIWLALGLVAGVVAQILLGAAVVLGALDPRLTMGHFLLSMVLVANAVVLRHRADGRFDDEAATTVQPRRLTGHRLANGLVALAAMVLVAGTIVTATGPHGGDDRAARLSFDLPTVARLHSSSVWLLLATLLASLVVATRRGDRLYRRGLQRMGAVALLQGGVGYLAYFSGARPAIVALHLLGATLLWVAAIDARLKLGLEPRRTVGATAPVRS